MLPRWLRSLVVLASTAVCSTRALSPLDELVLCDGGAKGEYTASAAMSVKLVAQFAADFSHRPHSDINTPTCAQEPRVYKARGPSPGKRHENFLDLFIGSNDRFELVRLFPLLSSSFAFVSGTLPSASCPNHPQEFTDAAGKLLTTVPTSHSARITTISTSKNPLNIVAAGSADGLVSVFALAAWFESGEIKSVPVPKLNLTLDYAEPSPRKQGLRVAVAVRLMHVLTGDCAATSDDAETCAATATSAVAATSIVMNQKYQRRWYGVGYDDGKVRFFSREGKESSVLETGNATVTDMVLRKDGEVMYSTNAGLGSMQVSSSFVSTKAQLEYFCDASNVTQAPISSISFDRHRAFIVYAADAHGGVYALSAPRSHQRLCRARHVVEEPGSSGSSRARIAATNWRLVVTTPAHISLYNVSQMSVRVPPQLIVRREFQPAAKEAPLVSSTLNSAHEETVFIAVLGVLMIFRGIVGEVESDGGLFSLGMLTKLRWPLGMAMFFGIFYWRYTSNRAKKMKRLGSEFQAKFGNRGLPGMGGMNGMEGRQPGGRRTPGLQSLTGMGMSGMGGRQQGGRRAPGLQPRRTLDDFNLSDDEAMEQRIEERGSGDEMMEHHHAAELFNDAPHAGGNASDDN